MSSENTSTGKTLQSAKELFKAGELIKAEDICRDILRNDPENAEAYNILGVIAGSNGKGELAVELINKAIKKSPNNSYYYNNLGRAYVKLGNHEKAIASYRRAVNINQLFGEAHNNLGNLLQKSGRLDEAIACYKKAIQCRPDMPQAYFNIGLALKELGFVEHAIAALKQAVTVQENYPNALCFLGRLLVEECRLKEAEGFFKRTLYFNPEYIEAYHGLCDVYRKTGEIEAALSIYKKILQLKPDSYNIQSRIASLINQGAAKPYYSADHPDIKRMKQLLELENLPTEDIIHFHFALGDMYDNCDLFDDAFHHFQQANLLERESSDYNMTSTEKFVDKIISAFKVDYFAKNKLQGSHSEIPVFIVGLPRSGKTLTENLIANHNQVIKGRELTKLQRLVTIDLPIKLGKKKKFPDYINDIDNWIMMEIAQEYEKALLNLGADFNKRIINTMPYNIFYLGMIAILFPNARIIYCKRDALDNCLAIYFKNFCEGNEYAFDLQEIGFYYRQYERLMDHWREVLPMAIHEVNYENLIKQPEDTAKDLIDFLGLDWDDESSAALRHRLSSGKHEENGLNDQFMHDRFIGRAQKYKKFLAPLEDSLKQFAE